MELVEGLSILGRYDFKPLTGVNAETYNGAIEFNSNIRPFISEIYHEDYNLIIILDREGIGIEYCDSPIDNNPTEYEVTSYHLRKASFEDALMFLRIVMLYNKTKEEILFTLKNFFEVV